jgi:hypothetical protein
MGTNMAFELNLKIAPVDPLIRPGFVAAAAVNPLGALADLPGKWVGKGFNQVWRPFHGASDRFLELNLTEETLEFSGRRRRHSEPRLPAAGHRTGGNPLFAAG